MDDLAAAAGVSHGVFYRYFENKDQLAIVLTVQAMRAVADAFVEIPDLTTHDTADLRRWLRRYNAAQSGEAAMIRVWVDAALEDARLRSALGLGVGLGASAYGACLRRNAASATWTSDAVVMVALLGAFGAQPPCCGHRRRRGTHHRARTAGPGSTRPFARQSSTERSMMTVIPGQRAFLSSCTTSPASLVSESTSMSETPRRSRPVRRGPQECSNS